MDATAPTFYKIDVTRTLVDAVELGEYPTQTTTVHKLTPPVQSPFTLQRNGMRPLNNRAVILSCFESFKQFLWAGFDKLKDKGLGTLVGE
jgi:hypothetical protein